MKTFFISSTFKDMQAERDILHDRVFPRLRKLAAEYGEDISELDLRWGVDTMNLSEEESGEQVLKVCIDAIDRCTPYIIVLLGERYGWIPEQKIVDGVYDERINQCYQSGMSITNLEIQYSAFQKAGVLDKCVFCFRNAGVMEKIESGYRHIYEPESALHHKKLCQLKEKIQNRENVKIIEYNTEWNAESHQMDGLDGFAEELYECLAQIMKKELKGVRAKNWKEQVLLDSKRTREQYLSTYVPRPIDETEFLACFNYIAILGSTCTMGRNLYGYGIHIQADAGVGKSAFMSRMADTMEKQGYHVISYYGGNYGCQGSRTLKEVLLYQLENIAEIAHEEAENIDERLEYLNQFLENGKIVCFVDALDQILVQEPDYEVELMQLCSRVIFVFSSLNSFPAKFRCYGDMKEISLARLSKKQAEQMIILTAQKRGKRIDEAIIGQILKKKNSLNPLYLSLILQRFFMMSGEEFQKAETIASGMQGIHAYMEVLLSEMPDDEKKMIVYLLKNVTNRFAHTKLLTYIFMIAMSDSGLSDNELNEICSYSGEKFEVLQFSQLVSYLYDAFYQKKDGRWTFTHRLYLEAVKAEMADAERAAVTQMFCEYAVHNREFCVKTGYQILFEQKDSRGYMVFEFLHPEDYLIPICEYIMAALENPVYEEYFLEMAKAHPSEALCEFWNDSFSQYVRNEKAKAFRIKVLEELLKEERISKQIKFELCKEVGWYYADHSLEKADEFSRKIEELCLQFSGNEQLGALAESHYLKSCIAWKRKTEDRSELKEAKTALQYIQQLPKEMLDVKIMRLAGEIVLTCYYYENDPKLLEELLKDLEHFDEMKYQRLVRIRLDIYGRLIRYYVNNQHFDADKFKFYREKGMELGKALVELAPSRRNHYAYAEFLMYAQDTYKWGDHEKILSEIIKNCELILALEDKEDVRYMQACCYSDLAYDLSKSRKCKERQMEIISAYQKAYELFAELYRTTGERRYGLNKVQNAANYLKHIKGQINAEKFEDKFHEIIEWAQSIYQEMQEKDYGDSYQKLIWQYNILENIVELYLVQLNSPKKTGTVTAEKFSVCWRKNYEVVADYLEELQQINAALIKQKTLKMREFYAFKLQYYQMLINFELYRDEKFIRNSQYIIDNFCKWSDSEYFSTVYVPKAFLPDNLKWNEQARILQTIGLSEDQGGSFLYDLCSMLPYSKRLKKICTFYSYTTKSETDYLRESYDLKEYMQNRDYVDLDETNRAVLMKIIQHENITLEKEEYSYKRREKGNLLRGILYYYERYDDIAIDPEKELVLARYCFATYQDAVAIKIYEHIKERIKLSDEDQAAMHILKNGNVKDAEYLLKSMDMYEGMDEFTRTMYFRYYLLCLQSKDYRAKEDALVKVLQCDCLHDRYEVWEEDNGYIQAYLKFMDALWTLDIEPKEGAFVHKKILDIIHQVGMMANIPKKISWKINFRTLLMKLRWSAVCLAKNVTEKLPYIQECKYTMLYFKAQDLSAYSEEELQIGLKTVEYLLQYASVEFWESDGIYWCEAYGRIILELYMRSGDKSLVCKLKELEIAICMLEERISLDKRNIAFIIEKELRIYQELVLDNQELWEPIFLEYVKEHHTRFSIYTKKEILLFIKKEGLFESQREETERMLEEFGRKNAG